MALQVCQATEFREWRYLDTLAAAYAEVGRFDEAVCTARRALALLAGAEESRPAVQLRERLRFYESRQPFRDVRSGPSRSRDDVPG
jgi:hypothetical protein